MPEMKARFQLACKHAFLSSCKPTYMEPSERLPAENLALVTDQMHVLSRKDAARVMGVTEQAVGQLIRGDTKTMKALHGIRLARRLGMSAEDFFSEPLNHRPDLLENVIAHSADQAREMPLSNYPNLRTHLTALVRRLYAMLEEGTLSEMTIDIIERMLELQPRSDAR